MPRKLFCEISPLTYKISTFKCRTIRNIKNMFVSGHFSKVKEEELLPFVIYKHNSLIRRKLGNTQMELQENKAVNLSISAPKINGILIRPGETFSFWNLVGSITTAKGYKEGVTISNAQAKAGVGGGLCQFTNLIHWMVLHTPLTIVEHHHHDGIDLFPDYNRQVPFGTGTSIVYNYLDYRFKNESDITYQLITYVTDTHLCGELRASDKLPIKYHFYLGCFPIYAKIPPSTYKICPFTKLDASLARNTAGPAKSSGLPQRAAGVFAIIKLSNG